MAWTETDLSAVEAAIKSGTLTVRYGDRTVTFHSLKELRALRNEMKTEIGGGQAKPRRSRTIRVFQSGRG